jgi:hypothetical protein
VNLESLMSFARGLLGPDLSRQLEGVLKPPGADAD